MDDGYYAVDLDGSLAHYDYWRGPDHIGAPIPLMVQRVKAWLDDGRNVKIFTARVSGWPEGKPLPPDGDPRMLEIERARAAIEAWCLEHIGVVLEVTCIKDFKMIALFDDRAHRLEMNTGRIICENCANMGVNHV